MHWRPSRQIQWRRWRIWQINVKWRFCRRVDALIRPSLRHYCALNAPADTNDFALQAEFLLSIQKGATETPYNNPSNGTTSKHFNRKPWNSRNSGNIICRCTSSPFRSSRRRPNASPELHIHTPNAVFLRGLIWLLAPHFKEDVIGPWYLCVASDRQIKNYANTFRL